MTVGGSRCRVDKLRRIGPKRRVPLASVDDLMQTEMRSWTWSANVIPTLVEPLT